MLSSPYFYINPIINNKKKLLRQTMSFDDNQVLFAYISDKIKQRKNFIIPRLSVGNESKFASYFNLMKTTKDENIKSRMNNYINDKDVIHKMKNNAGIFVTDYNSKEQYSNLFIDSIENSELFFGWDGHCFCDSQTYIQNKFFDKQMLWGFALDIFHYIHSNPWTLALKGKRILIISPFEDSIVKQIPIRDKIYGIDLFPECTFSTIKPPQTQGDELSKPFIQELNTFYRKLDELNGIYDIALVSCGGYGNIICNYIYKKGYSSICVGGVLQMYFGILGNRWLKERLDIFYLYFNKYWCRPLSSEKPLNHTNIEGSCYW